MTEYISLSAELLTEVEASLDEFARYLSHSLYYETSLPPKVCTCDIKQLFSYGHDKGCCDYKERV